MTAELEKKNPIGSLEGKIAEPHVAMWANDVLNVSQGLEAYTGRTVLLRGQHPVV